MRKISTSDEMHVVTGDAFVFAHKLHTDTHTKNTPQEAQQDSMHNIAEASVATLGASVHCRHLHLRLIGMLPVPTHTRMQR